MPMARSKMTRGDGGQLSRRADAHRRAIEGLACAAAAAAVGRAVLVEALAG
jgi:predicted naringenin-chalcone synthase